MKIKTMLTDWKRQKRIKDNLKYFNLSNNSIYEPAFSFRLTNPIPERKYIEVGSESMIGGNFIFETSEGHIKVGDRCQISSGVTLISIDEIVIDDDVIIAGDTLLYDHDSHSIYWDERKNDVSQQLIDYREYGNAIKNKNWNVVKSGRIHICSKVWIGKGVTILKGVTIGEGAVVGAKSVVTGNVQPYTVVAGNPAREVKKIISE